MIETADSSDDLENCLKDIGCNERTAKEFNSSDKQTRILILNRQRRALMDIIHENQKKVDRVDYIIDKIERG